MLIKQSNYSSKSVSSDSFTLYRRNKFLTFSKNTFITFCNGLIKYKSLERMFSLNFVAHGSSVTFQSNVLLIFVARRRGGAASQLSVQNSLSMRLRSSDDSISILA